MKNGLVQKLNEAVHFGTYACLAGLCFQLGSMRQDLKQQLDPKRDRLELADLDYSFSSLREAKSLSLRDKAFFNLKLDLVDSKDLSQKSELKHDESTVFYNIQGAPENIIVLIDSPQLGNTLDNRSNHPRKIDPREHIHYLPLVLAYRDNDRIFIVAEDPDITNSRITPY